MKFHCSTSVINAKMENLNINEACEKEYFDQAAFGNAGANALSLGGPPQR